MSEHNWSNYRHHAVRNLAWVLQAPRLFTSRSLTSAIENSRLHKTLVGTNEPEPIPLSFDFGVSSGQVKHWLADLEQSNSPYLIHKLNQLTPDRYRRLGLYFEDLVAFILEQMWADHLTPFRLLARNLQIAAEGRTFGELDFLLKGKNDQVIHLETAVKFYLLKQSTPPLASKSDECTKGTPPIVLNWQNWLGTNAKDRLDIKMNRMLQHQLTILKNPIAQENARARLNELDVHIDQVTSQYLLSGQCYTHYGEDNLPTVTHNLPKGVNKDVLSARWVTKTQLPKTLFEFNQSWCLLNKCEWLTGPIKDNFISDKQIIQLLIDEGFMSEQSTRPIHLCARDKANTLSYLMVVNDYWPMTNSPSFNI